MKILVAYDGSAEARNALNWAVQLARAEGRHTVTVISVIPTLEVTLPIADAVDPSSDAGKHRAYLTDGKSSWPRLGSRRPPSSKRAIRPRRYSISPRERASRSSWSGTGGLAERGGSSWGRFRIGWSVTRASPSWWSASGVRRFDDAARRRCGEPGQPERAHTLQKLATSDRLAHLGQLFPKALEWRAVSRNPPAIWRCLFQPFRGDCVSPMRLPSASLAIATSLPPPTSFTSCWTWAPASTSDCRLLLASSTSQ